MFLFATAAANTTESMGLMGAWTAGGSLMWVLLAMSVISVTMILYFLVTLRVNNVVPNRLRRDLPEYLTTNVAEARRLCDDVPSPLSAVMIATMDALRNAPNATPEMISKVAESEGSRQSDIIQGQTQWLLDIATIAPLVGLLGTVFGMLYAFGAVGSDVAAAKPTELAAGVSKAIVTTIFGLIVAIPSMAFYAWFRRRAVRLVAELEGVCTEFVAILSSKHTQE
ncbi:MAG: MotA/TolQ/ExbB proton channel family protein [bacterium]|nr:MotA/TolQ/ExbB proton channel family protein [bacterium]